MKLPDDPACYALPLSREFTHSIAQSYHKKLLEMNITCIMSLLYITTHISTCGKE